MIDASARRADAPRGELIGDVRLRVLHFITGLMTGGAEKALVCVALALRSLGVVSSVVAFRDGPIREELQQHGIDTKVFSLARPGALVAHVRYLKRLPAEERPTILQGWMYHANLAGLGFGRMLGVPVVWGIHQNIGDGRHDRLSTRLVIRAGAQLSRFADATVFISRSSLQQHLDHGYAARAATVIPNGFDTERFAPNEESRRALRQQLHLPQSALVIGHVARYHSVKNHSMFIRVARQVFGTCGHAHAVMVGRDVDVADSFVQREVLGTQYASRFHLLGERQDLDRLFCAMDLVCLTSWSESFPNVVGEAMACGIPCISTDVGDVRDIVGSAGMVVPLDDADAMTAAILKMASLDEAERAAIGSDCRARIVSKFSASTVAQRYCDLYRSLCNRNRAAAAWQETG